MDATSDAIGSQYAYPRLDSIDTVNNRSRDGSIVAIDNSLIEIMIPNDGVDERITRTTATTDADQGDRVSENSNQLAAQALALSQANECETGRICSGSVSTNIGNRQNSLKRPAPDSTEVKETPKKRVKNELSTISENRAICYPEYKDLVDLLATKKESISKQEIEAVEQFKQALNTKVPIQNRLAKLSVEQLRILLPYTYVEASHKLNPVLAYNTKDQKAYDTTVDDNVMMLKGYASFLNDLTHVLNSDVSDEQKKRDLTKAITKMFGILLNGSEEKPFIPTKDKIGSFTFTSLEILFNFEDFIMSRCQPSFAVAPYHLKALDRDIWLGSEFKDSKFTFSDAGFAPFIEALSPDLRPNDHLGQPIPQKTNEDLEDFMDNLSDKLLRAYKDKDMSQVFQLTSDFQYAHILSNANGRSSQIIRDCFALALDQAPYHPLTNCSQYIYFFESVDDEHLKFMQDNFLAKLGSVENFIADELTNQKTSDYIETLMERNINENSAIKFDIKCFLYNIL